MNELNETLCKKLMISKYTDLFRISLLDDKIIVMFKDTVVAKIFKEDGIYLFDNYTSSNNVNISRSTVREMCEYVMTFYQDLIRQYRLILPWYITKRRCKMHE